MQTTDGQKVYDVIIVGGGPAGCACALALKDSGLKVALIEKTSFPRDKVCGDAIPGRAIKTLKSIDPELEAQFRQFQEKFETKQTALYYKGKKLVFDWVQPAYTCTRMQFDNFLFGLVKKYTTANVYDNDQPETIARQEDGFTLTLKNSDTRLRTRLLIGADGAHSIVAKQLTSQVMDRQHHVGSVRAYYSNVACDGDAITEIYFDKQFLPSYLWVFPLPGNKANVGFGMLSSEIAARKVNIKKAFYEFIERVPELKAKFVNASPAGPLEGFGLPLGSKIGTLSGDNFMLTGDAASLIDPISGDGIGNAMLSGKLAAEQTIKCFKEKSFAAGIIKDYDKALLGALSKELQQRYRAQRMLSRMPWLLGALFFAGSNKVIKRLIQRQL